MFETKATQEALEFNLSSAVHSPVVHGVPGTASRRIWERFLVGRWQLMGEVNYQFHSKILLRALPNHSFWKPHDPSQTQALLNESN